MMNEPLTVYTLPGYIECDLTIHALAAAGVGYTVVDLATDDDAATRVRELGCSTVPIVTAGGATWTGHRPDRIRAVATARSIDHYAIPTDPMDDLQCDSCQ